MQEAGGVAVPTRPALPLPGPPMSWAVTRLETPGGPVYVATDDDVAADLRDFPDPDGNPRVVLSRSEIDATLSLACRIAPEGYTRLTLWRTLHDLVALKRAIPDAGRATQVAHQKHPPGCGLYWCSTCYPPVPEPPQHEQLELLE